MSKTRVLVVEDESIVAEDIRITLLGLGYEVSGVVPSGEKALELLQENEHDLVIMDIMLQGKMDGIEASERIRARFNLPVIYLTAYSDDKILRRAKVTEPFGYIVKPFKERELHINIEMALYKHKIENELKTSRKWYATTLQSIGDGVIATDSGDCVSYMNRTAELLTGWKLKEVIGKPLEKVYNISMDGDEEQTESPVVKTREEGVVVGQPNQMLLISRNKTKIPIEENGDPIKDDAGNIIGSVLVFRDVTERREEDEEIREYMELYETILESRNTGIFVTDKDDVICYINKKTSGIFENKPIVGTGIFTGLPDEIGNFLKPYYMKAKETMNPVHYEGAAIVGSEGRMMDKSGWLIPLAKDGTFNGIICTVDDL